MESRTGRAVVNSSNVEQIPKGSPVLVVDLKGNVCGGCKHFEAARERCVFSEEYACYPTDSCLGWERRSQEQLRSDKARGAFYVKEQH